MNRSGQWKPGYHPGIYFIPPNEYTNHSGLVLVLVRVLVIAFSIHRTRSKIDYDQDYEYDYAHEHEMDSEKIQWGGVGN